MNEKDKKKALREIIKEAVEKENAGDEKALSDEEMKSSGQELPPGDMLEKIKKAIEKAQN